MLPEDRRVPADHSPHGRHDDRLMQAQKGQHSLVRLPAAMISTGFLGERSADPAETRGPTLASPLLAEEGRPACDLSMSMA